MAKTLGYLITWTTYGTWLQGDERGYVKNGGIYPGSGKLLQANQQSQSQNAVKLSNTQCQIVHRAITNEANAQGQHIYALSVNSNHVHIIIRYIPQPIHRTVAYYKKAARVALKAVGVSGKLWTKGYDKRFCFDKQTLEQKIRYVQGHNE